MLKLIEASEIHALDVLIVELLASTSQSGEASQFKKIKKLKSEKSISGLMMGKKLKFSRRSNSKKNQRKDGAAAKLEAARENTEALKAVQKELRWCKGKRRLGSVLVNCGYVGVAGVILFTSWFNLTYALSNTKEDSDAWLGGFYTAQVLDIFW